MIIVYGQKAWFATGQPGINKTRLYRRIGGLKENYTYTYRNRGVIRIERIFYNMYK
jgi:hypothetical protein